MELTPVTSPTAEEYKLRLREKATDISVLEGKLAVLQSVMTSDKVALEDQLSLILHDPELSENPLVKRLLYLNTVVDDEENDTQALTKQITSDMEAFRILAEQSAVTILATVADKTILRGKDDKAVITVATKIKEDGWNPVLAYQYADSDPSRKGYIVRQVDVDRFKKAVRDGILTPDPGTYDFHVEHEVRIMKEALKTYASG